MTSADDEIRTTPRPRCYLCDADGDLHYEGMRDRAYDVPGEWSLRKCPNPACGLVWLDPCPIPEDIAKLYRNYYTHSAAGSDPMSRIHDWIARCILPIVHGYPQPKSLIRRYAGRLLAHCGPLREAALGDLLWLSPPPGRLLDIGCGSGNFLLRMSEEGWTVAGIEPDPAAAEVGRSRGLDVTNGTVETVNYKVGEFDVITLSHVIEHFFDPVAALQNCRRFLRPGGRVVVTTPNAVSYGAREFGPAWFAWEPPRHLIMFTRESLRATLATAGFRDIEITTPGRMARHLWRLSRQIRERGRVPNYHCGFQPWFWPQSFLFHLGEYRRSRRHPLGEELLATARIGGE